MRPQKVVVYGLNTVKDPITQHTTGYVLLNTLSALVFTNRIVDNTDAELISFTNIVNLHIRKRAVMPVIDNVLILFNDVYNIKLIDKTSSSTFFIYDVELSKMSRDDIV